MTNPQKEIDRLIRDHRDLNGNQLWDLYRVEHPTADKRVFVRRLRWCSSWTTPQPQPPQPMTALERDLRKHLAVTKAKTHQSAPSGPVNLGNASLPGEKD